MKCFIAQCLQIEEWQEKISAELATPKYIYAVWLVWFGWWRERVLLPTWLVF